MVAESKVIYFRLSNFKKFSTTLELTTVVLNLMYWLIHQPADQIQFQEMIRIRTVNWHWAPRERNELLRARPVRNFFTDFKYFHHYQSRIKITGNYASIRFSKITFQLYVYRLVWFFET